MASTTDGQFDRDLEAVIRGRLAGGTLDLIEDILERMERRVDTRVLGLLRDGSSLSPEIAQQAWYEKFAVVQLRDKLRQMARVGQSASSRITPTMEISNAA